MTARLIGNVVDLSTGQQSASSCNSYCYGDCQDCDCTCDGDSGCHADSVDGDDDDDSDSSDDDDR